MPWIRFDRNECPAPSLTLRAATGEQVSVADYRGRASLVLIFSQDPASRAARDLVETCNAGRREIERLGGELFIVTPSAGQTATGDTARHTLIDPGGELYRRCAGLLEFDVSGKLLVYILDEYGVPYAAWAGDAPDSPTLCYDIQRWLLYVSIQCPE
jgi:hypothetical protein